jgi:glycosyltransferase involved in cell wall biosynthesis
MLVGRFLRAAAAIICISDFSRREFTELFGQWFETKSYVAYHGMPREFETEIGRAKKAKEHLVKYILTVGTVYPKKNIARLISAFEQINDPELYLYIAGAMSKESDSIVSVAIQSTKSEKIKFVGSVNNVELANLYKNAVLFAFPSLHEGFGIPVLEAFMSGIPVVCSGNTSLPEIAGPGGAILFDPFDISDIKHCLAVALYDKQLRQKLIATGTQRARHFSWTRSANRHWEVFEAVNKINKKVAEFAKSQE